MTRFLIVNTDYPGFLDWLYANHPGLADEPYERQLVVRNESLFGLSDYYPRNLVAIGHDACEVHINNRALQQVWAQEHGVSLPSRSPSRLILRRRVVPWIVREKTAWMARVLAAQIETFRPDVILTHSLSDLPARFWKRMRGHYRLLVGQIASPLAQDVDLSPYDLMLSSLPNFVERFRASGLRAALLRLAFEPQILGKLDSSPVDIDVSFVGSLSIHHQARLNWLEELCRRVPIAVWGQGVDELPRDSAIRSRFRGSAWGKEMFDVLRRSRIALNHHIGLSGPYANNMRLFESTGVGALLLTDDKQNLKEMFEPDREVAVYRAADECAERIRYYLDHESKRSQIAAAGQARTLGEHTYSRRIQQLVGLLQEFL